ncbi:MAG: Uma2 family endonuclease [Dehalococcoidia bacterium]
MRLSRAEFHALYEAHPEVRKAELVDGVVFMPSPASRFHAPQQMAIVGWAWAYLERYPDVLGADNITTILPGENEVQPDCALWLQDGNASFGGDNYLHGAPEFVAEVTATSRNYDLGVKKELYRRAGVLEYLVWQTFDATVEWWALEAGEYVALVPGSDGVTDSSVFRGLRLNTGRLAAGDPSSIAADLR